MPPEARYPIVYESLRFRRPFHAERRSGPSVRNQTLREAFLKALMTAQDWTGRQPCQTVCAAQQGAGTLRFTVRYPWFERRRGKGPFSGRFLFPRRSPFSALSFQSEFEQAFDEIREGHAFDGGFAGNEAGGGHARRGVDFKDIQGAVILKDEVGAAVALEPSAWWARRAASCTLAVSSGAMGGDRFPVRRRARTCCGNQ